MTEFLSNAGDLSCQLQLYNVPWMALVKSRSRPGHWLVDLSANNCLGECACEDFRLNLLDRWKAAGKPIHDDYRCWHIRAFREWRLNTTVIAGAAAVAGLQFQPAPLPEDRISKAALQRAAASQRAEKTRSDYI